MFESFVQICCDRFAQKTRFFGENILINTANHIMIFRENCIIFLRRIVNTNRVRRFINTQTDNAETGHTFSSEFTQSQYWSTKESITYIFPFDLVITCCIFDIFILKLCLKGWDSRGRFILHGKWSRGITHYRCSQLQEAVIYVHLYFEWQMCCDVGRHKVHLTISLNKFSNLLAILQAYHLSLRTEFDSLPWFDTTKLCPFPRCDFLLNLKLLNVGFHGASAAGVACRQGTLTHPGSWSCPFWDFHVFYLLRSTLFLNFSLFFRTMHFVHPSVLSRFCLVNDMDISSLV